MGQKLHRGRRSVFKKRNPVLRTIGWIVLSVAVVTVGFFGAKFFSEHPVLDVGIPSGQPTISDPASTPDDSSASEDSTPATPVTPVPPVGSVPDTAESIQAFYLPHSALLDTANLTDTLQAAAAAGFNSVVFDLKGGEGELYYQFTSAQAQKVKSYTEDALSAGELEGLFETIRGAGLMPIPRLHAFRDHAGARALPAARIAHESDPGWVWYDDDPNDGGKAWLNPYADEAHRYIIELATELQAAGAAAIILDSVQFPGQTSAASFGTSSNTTLGRDEVLALFVSKAREALGDCPVILACTAESALGTGTQVYGNNPLTFAPTMAAPTILPGSLPKSIKVGESTVQNTPETLQQTVKALVGQMVLRTKVMADNERPALTPFLQAEGYTADQIRQEIAGCLEGGTDSYILYDPAGNYDFSALA